MSAKESQNVSFYAGDRVTLRFPLADATALAPAALTSPVGHFRMAGTLAGVPVLSKSSPASGASVLQENIGDVSWWVLYVYFEEEDTKTIPGRYFYQIRVVPTEGPSVVAAGMINIKQLIKTH
ncbi:hypothetical protein [Methylocystis sp. ATCC 49242]|uniref:hypothetical protein n=1 Tax=Methylocystis sp. ATCC 49242 TaxID=622637 RepID=UPI0001F86AAD|nr:hypothetical protein [Methylocystis sp. ATCC 49242]